MTFADLSIIIRVRLKQALGVVYPPRCPFCDDLLEQEDALWFSHVWRGRSGAGASCYGIHSACRMRLKVIRGAVCMHCGRPLSSKREEYCRDCGRKKPGEESFQQGRALYIYQEETKKMMYRFKYANRREYGAFFALETLEALSGWLEGCRPQVLLAVPMYRKKERRRGYNQAAVYGRELSRITGIPWLPEGIRRNRDTRPMKNLNPQERKKNLENAFEASEKLAGYRRVLVVDDIYTTGSTADEIAKTLHAAGVGEVFFLFVCIGKGV